MAGKQKRRSIRPAPKARRATATAGSADSKLDQIAAALRAPKGVTLADLMKLTGWQAHSVRGAIAGALKTKRGLAILSERVGDTRVYRIPSKA